MTDISTASAAGQVQGQLKNIRQVRLFMCLTSIDTPRSKPFTLVSNVSNYHDSYYYIKNMKFISLVEQDILSFALLTRAMSCSTLEKKIHISKHPCIILYEKVFRVSI